MHRFICLLAISILAWAQNCSYGCSQCIANSTQCAVACSTGWFNNSAGECELCILHCQTCSNNSTCESCANNFKVNSGGGCSWDDQTSNLGVILGVSLGLGLPYCIMMTCCLLATCCGDEPPRQEQWQNQRQNAKEGSEEVMGYRSRQFKGNATKQVKKRKWIKQDDDNLFDYTEPCSICLQGGLLLRTSCGHGFHVHCFTDWSRKDSNCPNCRTNSPYPLRIYCKQCYLYYCEERPHDLYSLDHSGLVCNQCEGMGSSLG